MNDDKNLRLIEMQIYNEVEKIFTANGKKLKMRNLSRKMPSPAQLRSGRTRSWVQPCHPPRHLKLWSEVR